MDEPAPPPEAVMMRMLNGFEVSQCLYVLADLDVFTILDQEGPTTFAQLSERTGADSDALSRIIRFVATYGVVSTAGDVVTVTELGATLSAARPRSVREIATMTMQMHYLPFAELRRTVMTGRAATEDVVGKPYFDWIAEDPQRTALFARTMGALTSVWREQLLDECRLPQGRVVADVGGGDGSMLVRLLQQDADTGRHGIVLELPGVVESARRTVEAAGLAGRVDCIEGDFFERVPPADVHLLAWILHDWDDEDAVRILRTIAASSAVGAHLLILEGLVPDGDAPHPAKDLDIAMLAVVGGKERSEQEYRALLDRAGYALQPVTLGTGPFTVLEAVRVADAAG